MLASLHEEYLSGLPSDWDMTPIEKIGNTYSGGTPSRDNPEFWNGSIDWVTPGELTKLSSKWLTQTRERITQAGLSGSGAVLLPKDTLLITTRATIGAVAIASMPVATNQGFKSIVLDNASDPLFYFYVIQRIASEFSRLASGSTFDEISRRDFVRVVVPQPPLPEQRRIAGILDSADEAIVKTEALISKLKQTKRGLMHDLLTRGMDERGNLRDPEANPEQFKDSPLGRIPGEWEVTTIGEQFERRTERGKPGLPVMSIVMNLGMVERDSVDRRVISNLSAEDHALARNGDIAYNMMRMWQGVLGRAPFDCLISPAYVVLNPKASIDTRYAEWLFRDERSVWKFRRFSQGVVNDRLRLYAHDLFFIKFAIPTSLEEQHRIAEVLDAHDGRIRSEEAYLAKLRLQKRGLMDDLLTGRVRVGGGDAPR